MRAFLGLASLILSVPSAFCAVDGTLTPPVTTSVLATPVVLHITGLTPGASATIERYMDANSNEIIDASEFLAERFTVIDGQVTTIGGIRNPNIPGDEDSAADGQISVNLNPSAGPELGRVAGAHIIRVSSPVSDFTTFSRILTVNQQAAAQSISGMVSDGTNPVPYAAVILLDATTDGEFVLGGVANLSGQFSINAPVGQYQIIAFAAGQVANFNLAPIVDLTASTNAVQNLTTIPGTTSLSGTISDASTSAGIGGIHCFLDGPGGDATIISTNADGTYTASVTAGNWNLEVSGNSTKLLGYLTPGGEPNATADTTSGAATGINIQLVPSTALIYGTVTGPDSNPLPGIEMGSDNSEKTLFSKAATDAAGRYVLAVNAGSWDTFIFDSSPGLSGFIIPGNTSTVISAGQAIEVDFMLTAVNEHITGTVTNMGAPVSEIRVIASNNGPNIFADTDANGNFDLGLVAGTWYVGIESSSAASFGVVGSTEQVIVTENQTVTGISIMVIPTTQTISGFAKNLAGQAINANLFANATIGGKNYSATGQTDGSGNYSLPLINGSWQVGAYAQADQGYRNPDNIPAVINNSNATVNFTFLTNLERWRDLHFGSPANSGDGADLNDFDQDDIPNLIEYALGLDPKANSSATIPKPFIAGGNLVFEMTQPQFQFVSGITYGAEWSTTLGIGSWTSLADTGTPPAHKFSIPISGKPKLFMRVKITRP